MGTAEMEVELESLEEPTGDRLNPAISVNCLGEAAGYNGYGAGLGGCEMVVYSG
jgi:hypothetical protein